MRRTALTTAVSVFAAAALLAGAGTAAADEAPPVSDPLPQLELGTPAGCVKIPTFFGPRSACLDPAELAAVSGSLGYGSAGTGSLADLLTGLLNAGSVGLSVDLPNATGSYAPGSTGSYGPEASVGQILTIPIASLGGAF